MLKNMKKLIAIALPVLTLSLTSCNRGAKLLSYEKARAFAEETYDSHALDTIPMVYTGNFNKMEANVDINYVTPDGGKDSSNISFGFNGIHVTINDRYAICLSSSLLDMVERYYSDFVAFAITIQDESPIDLDYILIDNSVTRIALTTSEKTVGKLLIRLLQMAASVVDLASSFGFIPEVSQVSDVDFEPHAETQSIDMVQTFVFNIMRNVVYNDLADYDTQEDAKETMNVIFNIMNYVSFSVFDSSEARGEVFHTYLTTDKYGFIRDLDFIFKSGFVVNGLLAMKEYDAKEPQEGDRPKTTSDPYRFTLDGAFDFDFNINAKYAK